MKSHHPAHWVLAGLCVLLLLAGYCSWQLAEVQTHIHTFFELRDTEMQTVSEEVTRQDGAKVTVVTTRNSGESVADWIGRHDAAVEAFENS